MLFKKAWHEKKHSPFSPDIALSDFCLFGYLKQAMAGRHFDDPDQLYSVVDEIPKDILIDDLLMAVIRSNGDSIR